MKKTEKARAYFAKMVKRGTAGRKREYDGYMLYQMTKQSGLKMCRKRRLVRRHHGIHIGSQRLYDRETKIAKRINRRKCKQWQKIRATEEYKQIYKLISVNKTVKRQMKWLKKWCNNKVVG